MSPIEEGLHWPFPRTTGPAVRLWSLWPVWLRTMKVARGCGESEMGVWGSDIGS